MRKYRCFIFFQSKSDSIPTLMAWEILQAETNEEARDLFCRKHRGYIRGLMSMHPFELYTEVRKIKEYEQI